MRRAELEHIIRASAAISGEREFVVVGTASLLASRADPPADLRETLDADLYPLRAPELASLIDGSIGELSPFHEQFRYYAQGVGPDTATLPDGWQGRLVPIQGEATNQAIAYCLEPHDLAASKLVASREKDVAFVAALLRHRVVDPVTLAERIARLPLPAARREVLATRLAGLRGRPLEG